MGKVATAYGSWPSPLSADLAAGSSVRFGGLAMGADGPVWLEGRPSEGGRGVLVQGGKEGPRDLIEAPFSARSKVHEYGGGAFLCAGDDIYFVNDADQDLYASNADGIRRLTDAADLRFADCGIDAAGQGLYAVAERHGGGAMPENFIARIGLDGTGAVTVVVQGADFYAAPRPSADGRLLAWLEWDLPHMPWEAARLMVAEVSHDGTVGVARQIGGGVDKSAFQPEWARHASDPAQLYFVEERGEWSGLYRWRQGQEVEAVFTPQAELSRPLWSFATRSYAELDDGRIAALAVEQGEQRLWLVDPGTGEALEVDQPHRQLADPVAGIGVGPGVGPGAGTGAGTGTAIGAGTGAILYAIASDDKETASVVALDLGAGAGPSASRMVRRPAVLPLAGDSISTGTTMSFETADGPVHAVYYAPQNPRHHGLSGELPPTIVSAHGGPTGSAERGLKVKTQFWTSRGFAFLDVDYRGSTGYGAGYRRALDGNWGLVDARDTVAAARAAAAQKLADPERLLICGSSAGGFTALTALIGSDVFRAAAISYGVADLATLVATTHKFEAGYLYALTGTEEGRTEPVFTERSPLAQVAGIAAPVLILQGLDDAVVPPEQSRDIAKSLRSQGVAVAHLEFAGEGHGFRRAETIRAALLTEYAFYAKVLGLEVAEPLPDIAIDNWPAARAAVS